MTSLAPILLVAACAASPAAGVAEAYLQETRSFCAEVGAYRDAYEAWETGGEWDDWHAEASALTGSLDEWEQARPDELPADIEAAIDDYYRSFVERLRGWDDVQALAGECDALVDRIEEPVASRR